MTVQIMAVDEYEIDRERQMLELAQELDCTIQRVHAMSLPGTPMCHEILYMTGFLQVSVGRELCEHPAIVSNPKWYLKACQIADLLQALYQDIAEQHLEEVEV